MNRTTDFKIRPANLDDLPALHELEVACFEVDRLSRRRLKHWILADNGILLVATNEGRLLGYCLGLFHRGTGLVRLYSLAVSSEFRGRGISEKLLRKLMAMAVKRGGLFMRLEVAQDNNSAIRLYEKLGFVTFGTYRDYYEDHSDALRMQRRIRYVPANLKHSLVPYYQQTTEFTCGPATLMMAMGALDRKVRLTQNLELDIWREATTIFMTAGVGGSHPVGLALAAKRRGFQAAVRVSSREPLFVDSVRGQEKKQILMTIHDHFIAQAKKASVAVEYADTTEKHIENWLSGGALVIMLISTYRMDQKKSPHWVTITAIDDECFYVHDPDPTEGEQSDLDCQYLPVLRKNFNKMSVFGRSRLRAAIVIQKSREFLIKQ